MSDPSGGSGTQSAGDAIDPAAAVERHELEDATVRSVRWTAGSQLGLQVVAFASTLVIARFIGPAEFGRAAIALIVVALASPLGFQAFGASLVRLKQVERSHLESVVFVSVATGAFLTCATFLLAPLLIEPFFGSRVAMFVQIISPAWLLTSANALPIALLQRRMDFRNLSIAETGSTLTGIGVTLGLAVAGFGGEAIVLGSLATLLSATLYYMYIVPLVRPRWHRSATREIVAFGLPLALSSLTYIAYMNVDYLIIGARLGGTATGLYRRGYQLAVEYQSKVSGILQRVAFPMLARADGLEDMQRIRARICRLHITILAAPILSLAPLAPALVPLLFGQDWQEAVRPTQLLVPVGLTAAIAVGIGPLFMAAGKPLALLVPNSVSLLLYAVVVYCATSFGLTTACVAVSVYEVVWILSYFAVAGRLLDVTLRTLMTDVTPGVVSGSVLLLVTFPTTVGLRAAGASNILIVIGGGTVAYISYALVLRIFFLSAWADAVMLLQRAAPFLPFARRPPELPQPQ